MAEDMRTYNSLLRQLRLCSDQLDKINGLVIGGSLSYQDNIKAHHVKYSSDDTLYCMTLVTKFEQLNLDISNNKDRLEKFMRNCIFT